MTKKSSWTAIANAAWALFTFILESIWKIISTIAHLLWKAIGALAGWTAKKAESAANGASKASATMIAAKAAAIPLAQLSSKEGSAQSFENWLYASKSSVGVILGARGSGKSALGMRLLENKAARGDRVYAMGFDSSAIPPWIGIVNAAEETPNGSFLLVDEGGILYSSRTSMAEANRLLSSLLLVARHKDLSILFISQNSANLEINSLRQADYLLLKKPSLLQKDLERGVVKEIYSRVGDGFKKHSAEKGLVYVYSDPFQGFASNALPSFWSDAASKGFKNTRIAAKPKESKESKRKKN